MASLRRLHEIKAVLETIQQKIPAGLQRILHEDVQDRLLTLLGAHVGRFSGIAI
jgi:hypothetical protein